MPKPLETRLWIPKQAAELLRGKESLAVFFNLHPARTHLSPSGPPPEGTRFLLPGTTYEYEVPDQDQDDDDQPPPPDATSSAAPPPGTLRTVRIPSNVIGLEVLEDGPTELPDHVVVRSEAAKLELSSVVLLAHGTAYLASVVGKPCIETVDVFEMEVSAAAGLPLVDAAAYLTSLETLLGSLSDRRKQGYRRFFFHMDRETESNLGKAYLGDAWKDRKGDVAAVLAGLVERLERRAKEETSAPGTYVPQTCGESLYWSAKAVSKILGKLLEEEFAGSDGDLDYARVEEAFETFANGELRLQLPEHLVWTTQPSTNYYFLFAELAFLCWENDVDASRWEKLLNVLVRTQEVFVRVYQEGKKVGLGESSGCAYREDEALTSSEKAELRAAYAWRSTAELAVLAARHTNDYVDLS